MKTLSFLLLLACALHVSAQKAPLQALRTDGIWVWDNGIHEIHYDRDDTALYGALVTQSKQSGMTPIRLGHFPLKCIPYPHVPIVGTSSFIHHLVLFDEAKGAAVGMPCREASYYPMVLKELDGFKHREGSLEAEFDLTVEKFDPKTGAVQLVIGKNSNFYRERLTGRVQGTTMTVYDHRYVMMFVADKTNPLYKLHNITRTYRFYPFGTVPAAYDGQLRLVGE